MTNINVGLTANDGLGDKLRDAFVIVNENFSEINSILTATGSFTISQVQGLQTALDNINNQLVYIPALQQDVNDINLTIYTINDSLNTQSLSIADLYTEISNLQSQIYTKIGDAPIDGKEYVRVNGDWSAITLTTGATGPTGPQGIQGPTGATGPQGEGSFQDLQSVTDYGNITTNTILTEASFDYISNNAENYGSFGNVPGKEYSALTLYSRDQSNDYFGTTKIFANPETGIEISDGNTDGTNLGEVSLQEGNVLINSLVDDVQKRIRLDNDNIYFLVNNNITDISNLIEIYDNVTYSRKYILTDEGFNGNYTQFNTAATETSEVGKLKWNDVDGTLDLGLKGGNVTLQLGQELVTRVVNKTGADLLESEFRIVRVRSVSEGGAQGQRLAVKLAQANNDFNSAETLGMVTETINNNQEGFITTFGQVRGINTTGAMSYGGLETWVDGDMLYLSPFYAGYLTNVKPVAPNHMVVIGYVEYAHNNNGKIYVKIQNGYELDELHNVLIDDVQSDDILTYDFANSVWTNKGFEEVIGYIPAQINAEQSSGVVIEFQMDMVYGTLATPETGNITADVTGGQLGVTCLLIHNNSVAPTFSSEFKKLSGSGDYVTGQINYIFFNYVTSTEIIYSINQRT